MAAISGTHKKQNLWQSSVEAGRWQRPAFFDILEKRWASAVFPPL